MRLSQRWMIGMSANNSGKYPRHPEPKLARSTGVTTFGMRVYRLIVGV